MKDHDTGSESRFGNSLNYFQKIIVQSGPAASAPYGVLLGLGLGLVSGFYQLGKTIWRGAK